jgi:hypothetical protein
MVMKILALWLVSVTATVRLAHAGPATAACAPCHRSETQAFASAAMTGTLSSAARSPVLQAHPKLTARIGSYSYELVRQGEQCTLTVSDGKQVLRVPILWAFGQGVAAQTFGFQLDGQWYESRVSYYAALNGLDLTIGAQKAAPPGLLEAAGHLTRPHDMGQCFDCHATNVGKAPALDLTAMTGGVQCGRCHQQAESHLEAIRAGRPPVAMQKLEAFSTEEMSDFCGQCHRTWSQIAADGPRGIQNVRFQPYRLANSKCYDAEDRRIRCTACHDPHRNVETSRASYDAKCTACHSAHASGTIASARLCKTGTRECVTCHMPELDLPGAHRKFTDHWIRIARAAEPYPD